MRTLREPTFDTILSPLTSNLTRFLKCTIRELSTSLGELKGPGTGENGYVQGPITSPPCLLWKLFKCQEVALTECFKNAFKIFVVGSLASKRLEIILVCFIQSLVC